MRDECGKINKLIYLYREDELAPPEKEQLLNHIRQCPVCSSEFNQAVKFRNMVSTAVEEIPGYTFNTDMESIFSAIEKKESNSGYLDKILDIFYKPEMRLALGVSVLLIMGIFFIQSSLTFSDISRLQSKMNSISEKSTAASVIRTDLFTDRISQIYSFLKGDKRFMELSGDLIIVDRNLIKNYLRVYNQLMNMYNSDPREFSKKYPGISRYFSEEIDATMTENILKDEVLLRDLNNILEGEIK